MSRLLARRRGTMTPGVSVRIAQSLEYAQLAEMYLSWGYQAGIASVDVVYVAELDARVIGLVRRTCEEGTTMLRGMQVDPAHQRHGVGSRLLDALVGSLTDEECFCIPYAHLTTFYGRVGFTVISEAAAPQFLVERVHRYRCDGHEVLIMHRPPRVGDCIALAEVTP